jgi:hypothetical protein
MFRDRVGKREKLAWIHLVAFASFGAAAFFDCAFKAPKPVF